MVHHMSIRTTQPRTATLALVVSNFIIMRRLALLAVVGPRALLSQCRHLLVCTLQLPLLLQHAELSFLLWPCCQQIIQTLYNTVWLFVAASVAYGIFGALSGLWVRLPLLGNAAEAQIEGRP